MKPGYKTTEFYITIVMLILGTILILAGHTEEGSALLVLSGVGYTVGRGLTKFNKP